ncbi:hypothetical protein GVAV_002650 [Gurleya vavrai]
MRASFKKKLHNDQQKTENAESHLYGHSCFYIAGTSDTPANKKTEEVLIDQKTKNHDESTLLDNENKFKEEQQKNSKDDTLKNLDKENNIKEEPVNDTIDNEPCNHENYKIKILDKEKNINEDSVHNTIDNEICNHEGLTIKNLNQDNISQAEPVYDKVDNDICNNDNYNIKILDKEININEDSVHNTIDNKLCNNINSTIKFSKDEPVYDTVDNESCDLNCYNSKNIEYKNNIKANPLYDTNDNESFTDNSLDDQKLIKEEFIYDYPKNNYNSDIFENFIENKQQLIKILKEDNLESNFSMNLFHLHQNIDEKNKENIYEEIKNNHESIIDEKNKENKYEEIKKNCKSNSDDKKQIYENLNEDTKKNCESSIDENKYTYENLDEKTRNNCKSIIDENKHIYENLDEVHKIIPDSNKDLTSDEKLKLAIIFEKMQGNDKKYFLDSNIPIEKALTKARIEVFNFYFIKYFNLNNFEKSIQISLFSENEYLICNQIFSQIWNEYIKEKICLIPIIDDECNNIISKYIDNARLAIETLVRIANECDLFVQKDYVLTDKEVYYVNFLVKLILQKRITNKFIFLYEINHSELEFDFFKLTFNFSSKNKKEIFEKKFNLPAGIQNFFDLDFSDDKLQNMSDYSFKYLYEYFNTWIINHKKINQTFNEILKSYFTQKIYLKRQITEKKELFELESEIQVFENFFK